MLRKLGVIEKLGKAGLSALTLNWITPNKLSCICIKFPLRISTQKMIFKDDWNLPNGLFVSVKMTDFLLLLLLDMELFSP